MLYELSTIAIAMYCSFYRNLYLEETKSISRSRHTILAKRKEIYQHAKVIMLWVNSMLGSQEHVFHLCLYNFKNNLHLRMPYCTLYVENDRWQKQLSNDGFNGGINT